MVLRVLVRGVEPVMLLLCQVRELWQKEAWGLAGAPLRIWQT